ncbi:UDP-glucuronosyltransferase 2B19 isoform X7 [Agrilus planipennis]|uniref:UDP-glucuronosyltransferase n=1 Tax=Agrilus planipennis TaxID=224129 RepID=A0A7F5RDZ0_AGRPL|nr:UDP-glucuronosyltransferase 2B19 isoform X7 [Agrilus planipennis]
MFRLLCFLVIVSVASGANIFAIFSVPSISHQLAFQPIWRELSLRGHKVTVVTPNPLKDPTLTNLTEIDVSYVYRSASLQFLLDNPNLLPDQVMSMAAENYIKPIIESQLNDSAVRKILKYKNSHFDLVISEMICSPAYGFAYKFNVPLVGMMSLPDVSSASLAVGNPLHPVLNPDTVLGYGRILSFWQRIVSTYSQIRYVLRYDYEIMPELDRIARKYFGDDMPYLGDIEKNVSIILTTHNFITSKPKPTVPALIEIGNVHLKKNVKLPQDLQKELDKATNGVIYFSLGSNVKSANISSQLRNVIISSFAELPYTILWKWETDHLPGKPDNVITRKWLPQEAVLAHPNVKAFITQGGLQSMEEAIYYRKPLIGMPFFADQMKNVRSIAEHGIGVALNTDTLTKEKLKSAILEVVNDKKYKEKISELSDLMWDQPMSGLDTAIWWIEYVIRHKGAKHLRSPLLDLPLYQYLLLDVLAFVFGVIATTLGLLYAAYIYTKPVIQGVVGKNKVKSN